MFEKEATTIFKKKATKIAEKKVKDFYKECGWEDYKYMISEFADVGTECFQKGAEFGYNKANEWHFVKDGDLPKECENVIINAVDFGINTCYVAHRLNGKWRSNCSSETFVRVIAWKEIVLPKEIE